MTQLVEKTFVKACLDHFGKLPAQNLTQFQAELKALDDNDRKYFAAEFLKIGVQVTATPNVNS